MLKTGVQEWLPEESPLVIFRQFKIPWAGPLRGTNSCATFFTIRQKQFQKQDYYSLYFSELILLAYSFKKYILSCIEKVLFFNFVASVTRCLRLAFFLETFFVKNTIYYVVKVCFSTFINFHLIMHIISQIFYVYVVSFSVVAIKYFFNSLLILAESWYGVIQAQKSSRNVCSSQRLNLRIYADSTLYSKLPKKCPPYLFRPFILQTHKSVMKGIRPSGHNIFF